MIKTRIGIYGIAIENGNLLVVKQNKGVHVGKYELPGGGIEPGEELEAALKREFREEVGLAFESMEPVINLTALTDGLYQIGLIYRVENLVKIAGSNELESFWIEPKALLKMPITPFLNQVVKKYL